MSEYYVDYTNGSDGNAGILPSADAKKTLAAGIALLSSPGDILYCTLGGAASEPITSKLTLALAGTTANYYKIIATNSLNTDDGTPYVIDATGHAVENVIEFNNSDYVVLKNFKVQNNDGGYYDLYFDNGSTHCIIDNFESSNCVGNSIGLAASCPYNDFKNCSIHDHGYDAFYLIQRSRVENCKIVGGRDGIVGSASEVGGSIVNCIIHGCSRTGVTANNSGSTIFIDNCIIDGCLDGVKPAGTTVTGVQIKNSVISNNTQYGIDALAGRHIVEDYNLFYNNGSGHRNGDVFSLGNSIDDVDPNYRDIDNDNFNRTSGQTLVATSVPVGTSVADQEVNISYNSSGFSPKAKSYKGLKVF